MSRQEISDATGFDEGDEFADADAVRKYFTDEGLHEIMGCGRLYSGPDQDILDMMANEVIENGWHMVGWSECVDCHRNIEEDAVTDNDGECPECGSSDPFDGAGRKGDDDVKADREG